MRTLKLVLVTVLLLSVAIFAQDENAEGTGEELEGTDEQANVPEEETPAEEENPPPEESPPDGEENPEESNAEGTINLRDKLIST